MRNFPTLGRYWNLDSSDCISIPAELVIGKGNPDEKIVWRPAENGKPVEQTVMHRWVSTLKFVRNDCEFANAA
ncbi:hypothetical protein HYW83_00565 [Candidatus Peregrinibacteria bacterium]|nr:hypothetical protein [Candidatus Peregrinibacteria bacterium]